MVRSQSPPAPLRSSTSLVYTDDCPSPALSPAVSDKHQFKDSALVYRFRYDDGTFHSKWETSDSLARVSSTLLITVHEVTIHCSLRVCECMHVCTASLCLSSSELSWCLSLSSLPPFLPPSLLSQGSPHWTTSGQVCHQWPAVD